MTMTERVITFGNRAILNLMHWEGYVALFGSESSGLEAYRIFGKNKQTFVYVWNLQYKCTEPSDIVMMIKIWRVNHFIFIIKWLT